MPTMTESFTSSAGAARMTRVRVARRGLELRAGLPALAQEVPLVDLMIDEVPGTPLARIPLAEHEAIRIDEAVRAAPERFQRAPPVVGALAQALEDRRDAAVAAREQRLQVGFARA